MIFSLVKTLHSSDPPQFFERILIRTALQETRRTKLFAQIRTRRSEPTPQDHTSVASEVGGGPHSSDQERALLRWSLLGLFSS